MSGWIGLVRVSALAFAGWSVVGGCVSDARRQPAPSQMQSQATRKETGVQAVLELTGSGLDKPTVFTFDQVAAMPMAQLDKVEMLKSHEPDEITSWRGPTVGSLLAAARIKPGRMVLLFEAADGYTFDCSPADMEAAIVAVQDGQGRWLYEIDANCPWRVVAPKKPGNYWLMNPRRITVEPAAGRMKDQG